jgi:hypothetical protein
MKPGNCAQMQRFPSKQQVSKHLCAAHWLPQHTNLVAQVPCCTGNAQATPLPRARQIVQLQQHGPHWTPVVVVLERALVLVPVLASTLPHACTGTWGSLARRFEARGPQVMPGGRVHCQPTF